MLFIFFLFFSFTGCTDKEVLPQGTAILVSYDKVGNEHQVALLVQEFTGETQSFTRYTATAPSAKEALQQLDTRYGNRFIWGSLQGIIIGKEAIGTASDFLSILATRGALSLKLPVLLADGTGAELLKEEDSATGLLSAYHTAYLNQHTVESTLFSTVKARRSTLGAPILISTLKGDGENGQYISGSVIIPKDGQAFLLTTQQSQVQNWLSSTSGSTQTTLDDGTTIILKNPYTIYQLKENEDGISWDIALTIEAQLPFHEGELTQVAIIQQEITQHIREEIFSFLYYTLYLQNSDTLGLQKRLNQWCGFTGIFPDEDVREMPFAISVKVSIDSWGG